MPLHTRPKIVASAIAVLIAASACGGPAESVADDLSQVSLRVGDQTGNTQALLEEAGLLDDVPYEIEWSEYAAAVNLHEALMAGAIDIGGAADAPTVSAIAGGSWIQVFAAWSNNGKGTALVVPEDSSAESLADLAGGEVSPSTRGSIAHFLLLRAVDEEGLEPDSVEPTFLAPVDAGAAFSAGELDAWATWNVYLARAQGEQGARVLVDGEDLLPGLYLLSATDDALDDPLLVEAMADYSARVDAGYAWGRDNPEEFVEFYADFAGQSVDVAERVADSNTDYHRIGVDTDLAESLEDTYATWVDGDVLPDRDLDLAEYVAEEAPAADDGAAD
ncbi:ABC transporter substrate-binding protein [Spiractinospora alimapuensis]|uniref:ABC transporter substrate-binding protein n=1 Tax=Spiractinospora alimapuensis TaxID=2820884 RepID=UPI001F3B9467|nr:ABC transporter substrate-binding protein [Spiractinospora alimapuensis]QVQ52901.1 ABC transporter substrate-binding protein [Spiractinospora alimapuensis]